MKGLCAWCVKGVALPVCAEELGGLPTPRKPCEIIGGDGSDVLDGKAYVQTEDGADKTAEFIAGANAVLALAKECGAKSAILKAKSPSCGCGRIYNGAFAENSVRDTGLRLHCLKGTAFTFKRRSDERYGKR